MLAQKERKRVRKQDSSEGNALEADFFVKKEIGSGYVSKKPRIHVLLMLKYEARL